MEEYEATSEAEGAYESLETELLTMIGAALLGTAAFDAKSLNTAAQDVYRKATKSIADSQSTLNGAALNDLIGMYIYDALFKADGAAVSMSGVLDNAQQSAQEAYGRYLNDARYMAQGMADNARRDYLNAARKAAAKVDRIGTHAAMAEAVSELAEQGITAYRYKRTDGVEVRVPVDVGIRRAINSNDNRISREQNTLKVAEATTGLVEVSVTAGARKSHAKWQGKVYQLKGSSGEYPNFYKACKWGDKVDGIGGYNCGHTFRVYHPSRGKQYKDPLEGTEYSADEARDLITRQRSYENELRKLKRERDVRKNLNLDTSDINKRIRSKSTQLNSLLDEHHAILKREKWRETIYQKAREKVSAYDESFFSKNNLDKISYGAEYKAKESIFNSKDYKAKVKKAVPDDAVDGVTRTIRQMIKHRDGTNGEDLFLIDLSDGRTISSVTTSTIPKGVRPTKTFENKRKKALESGVSYATLHNHSESSPPSPTDLLSHAINGADLGIIACHDGGIYTYRIVKAPDVGYNITERSLERVYLAYANRGEKKLFQAIEERFGIRIEHFV